MTLIEQFAALAARLVNHQSYGRDLEPQPGGVEITEHHVVVRLRRKPVVLIDPQPGPQPPVNRQERHR